MGSMWRLLLLEAIAPTNAPVTMSFPVAGVRTVEEQFWSDELGANDRGQLGKRFVTCFFSVPPVCVL